jgi:phage shock protein C
MNENNWLQDFTKSRTDRWLGGICGGLGENTPLPSWAWRLIFAIFFLLYGTGLLMYILLWIFVPSNPQTEKNQPSN